MEEGKGRGKGMERRKRRLLRSSESSELILPWIFSDVSVEQKASRHRLEAPSKA